ncbi:PHB depolymerase family esterase [Hydrogenophaga sp. 5NK40-0174]|uniref:extracellular catalytic domain type 1 short-chain-length polyhydroxyalkanoate depolymerase n=1 Tax=Hydrogenophaga sp. 5NK40-0174 TaxID=3127649 RepID=UPI003106E388
MLRRFAALLGLLIGLSACASPLQARRQAEARPGPETIVQAGEFAYALTYAGVERQYRLFVPTGFDLGKPMPMVLALHGGGGNMNIQANDNYYGLKAAARRYGYVVVFANGSARARAARMATWNAGICCGYAHKRQVDDVGFLRAVVDDVRRHVRVREGRVFATGMSNGGMMSHRLACEAPDVFRAVAAVAGTDGNSQCGDAQPVSVLHIHAKDDPRVPFEGGIGPKSLVRVDFVSVPETMRRWQTRLKCSTQAERVLEQPGAHCDLYQQCRVGAQLQLCVTDEGGHSWPGGRSVIGRRSGSDALSANDVIFRFFDQQR